MARSAPRVEYVRSFLSVKEARRALYVWRGFGLRVRYLGALVLVVKA